MFPYFLFLAVIFDLFTRALIMEPTVTLFRKKILKIGPMPLFAHLKIILL